MKRRSVIEAVIWHLKNDGYLGRNYLKGRLRDKINSIISKIGHTFRLLLKWIRDFLFSILYLIFGRHFVHKFADLFYLSLKSAY
jgi:IS5 family transposase